VNKEGRVRGKPFGKRFDPKPMKGQGEMLSHMLMVVFILLIVVIAVFFVFGFGIGQVKTEQSIDRVRDIMFEANHIMQTPLLAKDDGVLEDTKLANFVSEQGCDDIKQIISEDDVCIEVEEVLLSGENVQCFDSFDPKCNSWKMCEADCLDMDKSIIIESPVNIYKTFERQTILGLVRIKVPVE